MVEWERRRHDDYLCDVVLIHGSQGNLGRTYKVIFLLSPWRAEVTVEVVVTINIRNLTTGFASLWRTLPRLGMEVGGTDEEYSNEGNETKNVRGLISHKDPLSLLA